MSCNQINCLAEKVRNIEKYLENRKIEFTPLLI